MKTLRLGACLAISVCHWYTIDIGETISVAPHSAAPFETETLSKSSMPSRSSPSSCSSLVRSPVVCAGGAGRGPVAVAAAVATPQAHTTGDRTSDEHEEGDERDGIDDLESVSV